MSDEAIKTLFFSAPQFAVVGASKDEEKYGTKVLKWYLAREIPVTPVHPKEPNLQGKDTVASLDGLKSPETTSVSIITNPKVTLTILEKGKELGVPAFWLQPGAEDEAVKKYVKEAGLEGKVVLGGPCVLVEGDSIRRKSVL